MAANYILGIDLGTTNSVLAYAPLDDEAGRVRILPIPQLVAASTVENREGLPSFLYLGTEAERDASLYDLPWQSQRDFALGELARRQSADAPTRTVAAAKSWLANSRVDRHQPILPFGAADDGPKISPVEASRRYLEHLVAAWERAFPESPAREQMVVLTVPASFDAAARELTREAAIAAGLGDQVVLLEEPQAAVYAWLAAAGDGWRKLLKVGDTMLVCDIGGGTTDLTLVGVAEEQGELVLRRLAVGNHLLVGGDNMDLALAHHLYEAFAAKKVTLDPWQSISLWHACRAAKEALFAAEGPDKFPVSVKGRGSKLVGGAVSVDLNRKAAGELLLDGFFPRCALSDRPERRRGSGFRELGLAYGHDTAVTRHLAHFLSQQGETGAVRPTHVLFNGGVFKSPLLRERLFQVLGEWFPDSPVRGLQANQDLDLAVAKGAAYYGLAKQGRGVRIRGGAARSYYVGIETVGLAIPGAPRPLKALCVVPFGMEEGTEMAVPSQEFGLAVGEPAVFRFFSSALRKHDRPGDLLGRWSEDELSETDSLEANLPASSDDDADEVYVPVKFRSKINELGIFELWCESVAHAPDSAALGRWKLEFSIRDDAEA